MRFGWWVLGIWTWGCACPPSVGEVCDAVGAAVCLRADACSGEDRADACYDEYMRECCAPTGCEADAALSRADLDRCVDAIHHARCLEDGVEVPPGCQPE